MPTIDEAIQDTNEAICDNISDIEYLGRGKASRNILKYIRDLVEYVAQKVYSCDNNVPSDPTKYSDKKVALGYMRNQGKLRFLRRLHEMLKISASHYTLDKGGSERLMLKYYEYLLKIKSFLKTSYCIDILENMQDFPLRQCSNMKEYYQQIANRINNPSERATQHPYGDRVYIQKIKPFFINQKTYYEVTFTMASDKASKFDRVIAFTDKDVLDNYSVKLSIHNDCIDVLGRTMVIQVIDSWEVSIRACEIKRFSRILGQENENLAGSKEFRNLMQFLKDDCCSLVDIVTSSDDYYSWAKDTCSYGAKVLRIFPLLDKCRKLLKNNLSGSNVVRYLLHKMNNKIMKSQYSHEQCAGLSGLYLDWGCKPFDDMPYATSLRGHNPRIADLLDCISPDSREHELFARAINNNTEQNGILFTPEGALDNFENLEKLQNKYNSKLYKKHTERRLQAYQKHWYVEGAANYTAQIIIRLQSLSSNGIGGYTRFVESWLNSNSSYRIDCYEKMNAIKTIFSNSRVALIYGSAGTGKSTLINHISNLFNNWKKIYIANTHPAVENMRRKVNAAECSFKTINKALREYNGDNECDILFIDECSTVSNKDMREILDKVNFKLLVLVGDVFQIESILFGNWFSIARDFVPKTSVFELTKPFRSTNEELLAIWKSVRNFDPVILEKMVTGKHMLAPDFWTPR